MAKAKKASKGLRASRTGQPSARVRNANRKPKKKK